MKLEITMEMFLVWMIFGIQALLVLALDVNVYQYMSIMIMTPLVGLFWKRIK